MIDELWHKALKQLRERIGDKNFETWIEPIKLIGGQKNEITLAVPNKFFRDWLTEHFVSQMEDVLSSLSDQSITVLLKIDNQMQTQEAVEKGDKKEDRERAKPQRTNNLIPKYTFENFVIGASNQFAH